LPKGAAKTLEDIEGAVARAAVAGGPVSPLGGGYIGMPQQHQQQLPKLQQQPSAGVPGMGSTPGNALLSLLQGAARSSPQLAQVCPGIPSHAT
jgi:hypothetical protein